MADKPVIPVVPPTNFPDTLTPFRHFCQRVLPAVYGEELSYYELLCKVTDYLNKTMSNVNELNETVKILAEFIAVLQKWIQEYFNNLDVQEEINKKLDEMVESGQLDMLIGRLRNQILGHATNYANVSKVFTFEMPDNHVLCCMAADPDYTYIVHHINDTGYLYVSKFVTDTWEFIKTIATRTGYHGNSCDIVGNYLVICGSSQFAYVDLTDFSYAGYYEMPSNNGGYTRIAASHNGQSLCLGSTYSTTYTYFGKNFNGDYQAYNRINSEPIGNMLRQDMCGSDTWVYSLESGLGQTPYNMNLIRILSWNGDIFKIVYLPPTFTELEGIARPSGAAYILLADVNGDIYKFDTSDGIIGSGGHRYRASSMKAVGLEFNSLGRSATLTNSSGTKPISAYRRVYLPQPIGGTPYTYIRKFKDARLLFGRSYLITGTTQNAGAVYQRGGFQGEGNIVVNSNVHWTLNETDFTYDLDYIHLTGYNISTGEYADSGVVNISTDAQLKTFMDETYQTFANAIGIPNHTVYLNFVGMGTNPTENFCNEFSGTPTVAAPEDCPLPDPALEPDSGE